MKFFHILQFWVIVSLFLNWFFGYHLSSMYYIVISVKSRVVKKTLKEFTT